RDLAPQEQQRSISGGVRKDQPGACGSGVTGALERWVARRRFHARERQPLFGPQIANCLPIGSDRMRLPVAAKIALISAGANGGTPGSPTPLGGLSAGGRLMWGVVTTGDSSIRTTGKPA